MLESSAGQAIARLVSSVLAVKPVAERLPAPIRVVPTAPGSAVPPDLSAQQWAALARLLERVAGLAGVPGLTLACGTNVEQVGVFERVVSTRVAFAELATALATDLLPSDADEVDRIAVDAVAGGFDAVFGKQRTVSSDGLPLTVYSGGTGEQTVVVIPACGMPATLAECWLRFLARDYRVLTWDSRGLFGPLGNDGDFTVDTQAQADDLFTVLDHFGADAAHVVGLCGGAVIGLAAAAARPERVRSLSLWHGAYEFASGSPRTKFQNDLIELMTIAALSRPAASSVQAAFCQVTLTNTPAELAHLLLYPYTSPELFYRYCRLNGALARTDVEQYLAAVTQPALVVTSRDDETAHPQGSRQVAEALLNASLRVEPHGDHTSLFQAGDDLVQVAVDFIQQQTG
jgi:3-oxoadipate enol-lactonase